MSSSQRPPSKVGGSKADSHIPTRSGASDVGSSSVSDVRKRQSKRDEVWNFGIPMLFKKERRADVDLYSSRPSAERSRAILTRRSIPSLAHGKRARPSRAPSWPFVLHRPCKSSLIPLSQRLHN